MNMNSHGPNSETGGQRMRLNFILVGNDESALDFVRARMHRVHAAIASLGNDQCVVVRADEAFAHDRALTYDVLRSAVPDGDWDRLSRQPPPGAASLVIFNGGALDDAPGTALLCLASRTPGLA